MGSNIQYERATSGAPRETSAQDYKCIWDVSCIPLSISDSDIELCPAHVLCFLVLGNVSQIQFMAAKTPDSPSCERVCGPHMHM